MSTRAQAISTDDGDVSTLGLSSSETKGCRTNLLPGTVYAGGGGVNSVS